MITIDQIKEFADRVAEEYHPEKLVLFGSYANGNPTEDSGVDLLVVMPFEGKAVYKSVEMRMKLRPGFPLDILVRTPEKVRERLSMGDGFMKDVLENGMTLYKAGHH